MAQQSINTQAKALIVAPAWVGDMVMAHTLVQLLSRDYAHIDMAAPVATRPLAMRMQHVRHSVELPVAHGRLNLRARWRVGRQLAGRGYAAAFVLPNSWKSAWVPVFAGIPRRVGWHGEARYGLLTDRRRLQPQRYPLMIERFMALAHPRGELPPQPYPVPRLQADPVNLADTLARLQLDPTGVVGMCPGAEFGAAKKWPVAHYAQVARQLLQAGQQVWLFGSPKDAADCAAIADLAPGVTNLAGQTTLLDAVDLISVCQQVICNDSGLMHVACALDVPTIGIYGSTSPGFTPPLGPRAQIAQISLSCRPCFQRTCPLGHLNCLNQLHPEQVSAQLLPELKP